MYGSSFDFSGVTLPGVGGSINASNAISGEQLKKMNATGKKWRPGIDGMMSHHNESILKSNAEHREKREALVNREYNENADGKDAMKEIFARKKSRMSSFKELKAKEYKFAEGDSQDSELLSMPLPSFKEDHKCTGPGCPVCTSRKYAEMSYREWNVEKRRKLKKGEIEGDFAGDAMSFPIASPGDVSAAWANVGRAPNPRATMKKIIAIAKKYKWESGLPESVKQRMDKGESGLPTE
jgi:hypothetical protein